MKRAVAVLMVIAFAGAAARWARRRAEVPATDSDRAEQADPSGEPVVDVWGHDSFPASDPPQSW